MNGISHTDNYYIRILQISMFLKYKKNNNYEPDDFVMLYDIRTNLVNNTPLTPLTFSEVEWDKVANCIMYKLKKYHKKTIAEKNSKKEKLKYVKRKKIFSTLKRFDNQCMYNPCRFDQCPYNHIYGQYEHYVYGNNDGYFRCKYNPPIPKITVHKKRARVILCYDVLYHIFKYCSKYDLTNIKYLNKSIYKKFVSGEYKVFWYVNIIRLWSCRNSITKICLTSAHHLNYWNNFDLVPNITHFSYFYKKYIDKNKYINLSMSKQLKYITFYQEIYVYPRYNVEYYNNKIIITMKANLSLIKKFNEDNFIDKITIYTNNSINPIKLIILDTEIRLYTPQYNYNFVYSDVFPKYRIVEPNEIIELTEYLI